MLFCGACGRYAELACAGLARACRGFASAQRSKLPRLRRLEHPVKRGVFFEESLRALPACAALLDEQRGGAAAAPARGGPPFPAGLDDPDGDPFADLSD